MAANTASLRAGDVELEERAKILCDAARRLPALTLDEREGVRAHVLGFLRNELVEHMKADEEVLFPAIAERLGDPLVAAPMHYDHRAIRWWTERIARADLADVDELQRLLYGVHALIKVHLSREEDLYVDAVDAAEWPAGR